MIWKPNEIFVIDKRYSIDGINQTLEEIGNQLNLTRERARQIISKAVDKLKKNKDKFLKIIGTLFDIYKTDEIFETTSEQFLQIDSETIVRKEIASINKFELEAISKSIKLHIYNYGSCYISEISSYVNYPNIKYKWNKYLLLGVVRSYLKDEYSIIQTNKSNNYLNLEFEIRRN